MNTDVAEKVIGILAAQALIDPSEISLDASIDSIGLDSLGMVEAIFAIEETFDIAVPFNPSGTGGTGFTQSSVANLVAAIEGLMSQKAA